MENLECLCTEFDTSRFLVYKWHPDSYKTLEKYVGCETDIILPEGIEYVKEDVFWHYDNMESITFPKTLKGLYSHMLIGSERLRKVIFNDCQIKEIPESFLFGSGVEEIVFPNNIKKISESAFSCCKKLEKIVLPDSVEEIERFAFYNCDNLKQVFIGKNCKDIAPSIFDGNCDYSSTKNAVLYYPDDYEYVSKIPKNIKAFPKSSLNKKGCYIATCVYGSYDCPAVWTLRRYRDYKLEKNPIGRLFIKIYYAVSPAAVELFGNQEWFRKLFKTQLDGLVERLQNNGVESTPYDD